MAQNCRPSVRPTGMRRPSFPLSLSLFLSFGVVRAMALHCYCHYATYRPHMTAIWEGGAGFPTRGEFKEKVREIEAASGRARAFASFYLDFVLGRTYSPCSLSDRGRPFVRLMDARLSVRPSIRICRPVTASGRSRTVRASGDGPNTRIVFT